MKVDGGRFKKVFLCFCIFESFNVNMILNKQTLTTQFRPPTAIYIYSWVESAVVWKNNDDATSIRLSKSYSNLHVFRISILNRLFFCG